MLRLVLIAVTFTLASTELLGQWAVFKATYGRSYNQQEDALRRDIFEKNLQFIEQHNDKFARGESSFYLGVNKFADMTFEEFKANATSARHSVHLSELPKPKDVSNLPTEVDWVAEGYVTDVVDQGDCYAGWALGSVGSIEGQYKKATGELVTLSTSQLVDCSFDWGNNGCSGGYHVDAFKYVRDIGGIQDDESYPFVDYEQDCYFDPDKVVTGVSSHKEIKIYSEDDLQEKVAEIGPIASRVDATEYFQLYAGGVLDDPICVSCCTNHGVLVVGYGVDEASGGEYWLVKNSYGESWGEDGYIKMSRNKENQCGIATLAGYPIL